MCVIILLVVIPNAIMLSVTMLIVVMLRIVMLRVGPNDYETRTRTPLKIILNEGWSSGTTNGSFSIQTCLALDGIQMLFISVGMKY